MNNKGGLVITIRDGEGVQFTINGEVFEVWFKKQHPHWKLLINADKETVKVQRVTERVKYETATAKV